MAVKMKALSIRQPWAWAILCAHKRIENRSWNPKYRGPFLIHAAKGCTRSEYNSALTWIFDHLGNNFVYHVPPLAEMAKGGIVGRARLVDVIPPQPTKLLEVCTPAAIAGIYKQHWPTVDHRWHEPNWYGLVLADVEPLPFRPCKGSLGLFDLDAA